MKRKIIVCDWVKVVDVTMNFREGEIARVLNIERGARLYKYYCYHEVRRIGEWLNDKQIKLLEKVKLS